MEDPTHFLIFLKLLQILLIIPVYKTMLPRRELPVIIKLDVPGLENTLVTCLKRLFKTKCGAPLTPQYMPLVQVGLQEDSQAVVTCLLEDLNNETDVSACLSKDYNIYSPCLIALFMGDYYYLTYMVVEFAPLSNEQAAVVAMYAIKELAGFLEEIIPSAKGAAGIGILALSCSSLVRGDFVYRLNLLNLLEKDVRNVSNNSLESILRSRARMISGWLLCKEIVYSFVDETSIPGATLLLSGLSPAARQVIDAAFVRQGLQGHGRQLVTQFNTSVVQSLNEVTWRRTRHWRLELLFKLKDISLEKVNLRITSYSMLMQRKPAMPNF